MKKAVFITVRTASTRLPQKCLLEINGTRSIEHLIKRLKGATSADEIILCTSDFREDNILSEIAAANGIKCFRGPAKDKLVRWKGAAESYDVDFFVTADGDDILCEPELIDLAFEQYERNHPDFIEAEGIPCGAFTFGIKTTALRKVCEIKDTDDTEMMWVYFTRTGLFKTEKLQNIPEPFKRPDIRMTLDYKDDLRFFEEIIAHFSGRNGTFRLGDIIQFLDENPDVMKINQHCQQEFLHNQKMKTKLVLKKEYASL